MASNKCRGVLVTYECIENSDAWGKRGDQNKIFFPEDMYSYERSKKYAPSNWKILFTDDAERTEDLKIVLRGPPSGVEQL